MNTAPTKYGEFTEKQLILLNRILPWSRWLSFLTEFKTNALQMITFICIQRKIQTYLIQGFL